jgi:hypothetical protein
MSVPTNNPSIIREVDNDLLHHHVPGIAVVNRHNNALPNKSLINFNKIIQLRTAYYDFIPLVAPLTHDVF